MRIKISKLQWEKVGAEQGWIKSAQAQQPQQGQQGQQPQQGQQDEALTKELTRLMTKIYDERDVQKKLIILKSIYNQPNYMQINDLVYQAINKFLEDKIAKYRNYTPQQKQGYIDMLKRAVGE